MNYHINHCDQTIGDWGFPVTLGFQRSWPKGLEESFHHKKGIWCLSAASKHETLQGSLGCRSLMTTANTQTTLIDLCICLLSGVILCPSTSSSSHLILEIFLGSTRSFTRSRKASRSTGSAPCLKACHSWQLLRIHSPFKEKHIEPSMTILEKNEKKTSNSWSNQNKICVFFSNTSEKTWMLFTYNNICVHYFSQFLLTISPIGFLYWDLQLLGQVL